MFKVCKVVYDVVIYCLVFKLFEYVSLEVLSELFV